MLFSNVVYKCCLKICLNNLALRGKIALKVFWIVILGDMIGCVSIGRQQVGKFKMTGKHYSRNFPKMRFVGQFGPSIIMYKQNLDTKHFLLNKFIGKHLRIFLCHFANLSKIIRFLQ